MKVKNLLRQELAVAALITFVMALFGCGDFTATINPYHNDIVKVTDVNKHVSDADEKAGTIKAKGVDVTQVLMSHKAHENANVDCKACHHKVNNDNRIKQCAQCHKGVQGRDVMHEACITCHLKKNEGPVQCQECHEPVLQKL